MRSPHRLLTVLFAAAAFLVVQRLHAAPSLCGTGFVTCSIGDFEECDDGNTANGDGCSASCETETAPKSGGGCSFIQGE